MKFQTLSSRELKKIPLTFHKTKLSCIINNLQKSTIKGNLKAQRKKVALYIEEQRDTFQQIS